MSDDAFYKTRALVLRAEALLRDQGRCTVPGCNARATIVDHIIG